MRRENHSFGSDAPLDSLVKTRLICDLFNLACVPLVNRKLAGIEPVRATRDESCDSDDLDVLTEKTKKIISPSKRGMTSKVSTIILVLRYMRCKTKTLRRLSTDFGYGIFLSRLNVYIHDMRKENLEERDQHSRESGQFGMLSC
ncbi:unnamed protein product [Heligmosomoides polygyrus]|uniref:Uncharacterized protein n=1 Tax=Heligmosomoides polygyrus TaxID=6339 RepID=A0A183FLS9_HELPZ|nr:unnamed protein product [Heligmosomoides polygyrus]